MREKVLLILAAVLCLPSIASSVTMFHGVGATSCGAWTTVRPNGDFYTRGQWALGFLSAAGFYGFNIRGSDSAAIFAYLDKYCLANPLEDFSEGVIALAEELHSRSEKDNQAQKK